MKFTCVEKRNECRDQKPVDEKEGEMELISSIKMSM